MSNSDKEEVDASNGQEDYGTYEEEYDNNEEEYANIDTELDEISNFLEDADRVNAEIQEKAESTKSDAKEALAEQEKLEADKMERDARSIFVKNVHWDATADAIVEFFSQCGQVESCKILLDHNNQPKGCVHAPFSLFSFSCLFSSINML